MPSLDGGAVVLTDLCDRILERGAGGIEDVGGLASALARCSLVGLAAVLSAAMRGAVWGSSIAERTAPTSSPLGEEDVTGMTEQDRLEELVKDIESYLCGHDWESAYEITFPEGGCLSVRVGERRVRRQ